MQAIKIALFAVLFSIAGPLLSMEEEEQKINNEEANKSLLDAALFYDLNGIKRALGFGAFVEATDKHGNTALMLVCRWPVKAKKPVDVKTTYNKQKKIVNYLISTYEADVNARNNKKQTALLMAADSASETHEFYNGKLVQLLISKGASTKKLAKKHAEWAKLSKIDKLTHHSHKKMATVIAYCTNLLEPNTTS